MAAIHENSITYRGHFVRYFELGYFNVIQKQMLGIKEWVTCEIPLINGRAIAVRSPIEGYSTPCGQIGDVYLGQAITAVKSLISNTSYAMRDGDGGQTATAGKSAFTDVRQAVGDGDRGQVAAM